MQARLIYEIIPEYISDLVLIDSLGEIGIHISYDEALDLINILERKGFEIYDTL